MDSVKDIAMAGKAEHLEGYRTAIARLEAIIKALEGHKGKLIDKRFFDRPDFKMSRPGTRWDPETRRDVDCVHDYPTVYLALPRYSFQDITHRIIMSGTDTELELKGRETAHALEAARALLERVKGWAEGLERTMGKLRAFDEAAMRADLLAVFEKHGKPTVWREVLEDVRHWYDRSE